MHPPNYLQKRVLITVLLLTVLPLTPFCIVWTESRSGIFPFCSVLVLVDSWLLLALWLCVLAFRFWLLLVLASVFGPSPSSNTRAKWTNVSLIFPYVPFILCISPQLLICHIFQHVHVFHVMFLQCLWRISQTSCIWHHFHDLAFLFHFSICSWQHSLNRATWGHYISNWKERQQNRQEHEIYSQNQKNIV